MKRQTYPTDLTDAEWQILEPILPLAKRGGRPRITDLREVLNAIFYLLRTGCAWRMLPPEFPTWQTVYFYFRSFRRRGLWTQIHHYLRRKLREKVGRSATASAGIIDSQSVKTTDCGGEERGYDGAKKVNGRKRHLLVDTQGLVLKARVHSAKVSDREGIKLLFEKINDELKQLDLIWLDMGYQGKTMQWLADHLKCVVEIVKKPRRWGWYPEGVEPPPMPAFTVLKRRWVVERTFGWLGRWRRLSKDYERLPRTSEAMVYLAMTKLMLKRLTRAETTV
jgi:putative transposase